MLSVVDAGMDVAAGRELPFVTIVMPALNEERYIARAIGSILPDPRQVQFELLVVDGGSTDRTCSIVAELAAANSAIRLIRNERRIQSAAVNIGAHVADPRARFLLRADCHLEYPPGFVARCIDRLGRLGVASVVVPMHTQGTTCLQRAIAAAQNSRLGNGGAAHRLPGYSGYVDHGHHAAFDRAVFLEIGGYDERFTHNEDAEFDRRLIAAGHRIYLDGDAVVTYHPRADFVRLARQYFAYGWGRAGTIRLHGGMPRLRQVLPVLAVLGSGLAAIAALYDVRFLIAPAAYVVACLAFGLLWAVRDRQACLALAGLAAVVMHMSWGAGFLARWCSERNMPQPVSPGRSQSGRSAKQQGAR